HASFLLPSFIAMEAYFVSLAGNIPFKRVRQFWIGLAPVFIVASMKALFYGPHKKPKYKVTRKENIFGNYTYLVWSQLTLLGIIFTSLAIVIVDTPLYSGFDWAALFWGFYMASYFLQIIKVSIWNWNPTLIFEFSFIE